MKKLEIKGQLPIFNGYYCTIFEPFPIIEDYIREEGISDDYDWDWENFNRDSGEVLCEIIQEEIASRLGIELEVKYEGTDSPRFYNYRNDIIDAIFTINEDEFNKFFDMLNEWKDEFQDYLLSNYTSCDGYISGYSNRLKDWLNKDKLIANGDMFSSVLNFMLLEEGSDTYDVYYEWIEDMDLFQYIIEDEGNNDE